MSKKILYYTGKTAEKWGPHSLETGVSGSQTAVINLSQVWSCLGYDVTVCANTQEKSFIYKGVKYINYHNFDNKNTYDIAILWREPSYFTLGIKARKYFLDLHDIPELDEYNKSFYNNYNYILVKSNFHRDLFNNNQSNNLIIIPNGISSDLTKRRSMERNKFRLIYASNYFRGLEQMLLYGWPLIKKEIPQMSLDIYYGWEFFDKANKGNKERIRWKGEMVDLIKNSQASEHGRIGQERLTDEMLNANILYYGCTFPEIDCIVTRQAAAAGCIPFTSDFAVFKEKSYCITSPGDFSTPEAHINLAKLIIKSVNSNQIARGLVDEDIDKVRLEFIKKSSEETWDIIGKKWAQLF